MKVVRSSDVVTVTEPALLIRIAQSYHPDITPEGLYEVTRGVWRVGPRREQAEIALAVADGIVREVYAIHHWHPAASTPYRTRPFDDVNVEGRWEFTGKVASDPLRNKYLDQSVAHYFARGNVSPVMYVNG